ncbi:MAG: nucleotidyl transferase AbiEii/AbiGii toxin family protein, partial [Armatimonadetes bacterium]|nr:nucleotidyl transferase AbiEii/AbiGii toxin family protein [Armatimonadota bacterium]
MREQSITGQLRKYARDQKKYVDLARRFKMYVIECAFRRIDKSTHRDELILKGAMALTFYIPDPARSTKDADFLARTHWSAEHARKVFEEILAIEANDGVVFDIATLRIQDTGADRQYPGYDLSCNADLEGEKIILSIDLCFGETVTPGPKRECVTRILDVPKAELLVYPLETILAEKTETIVSRGMPNSRLIDYLDIVLIARNEVLDGTRLISAFRATFLRRKTPILDGMPTGLTSGFYDDSEK